MKRAPVAVCGTDSGYQKHRGRGERPCDPCRAAHAAASGAGKRERAEERRDLGLCPTCAQPLPIDGSSPLTRTMNAIRARRAVS